MGKKNQHSIFRGKVPTLTSSIIASMLFASASATSYAADEAADDEEFEEVIVTGSRTGKALNKIPGAVSIISEAEIARDLSLTSDLTAMLSRTVPGYGQSKQQMDRRGETLRGRTALRLLDGVPQGSPLRDGSRDSIFTDMGIIQRVEVVNGPSATEGIGASGGIINYITRTPTQNGTEVMISTQYRSQFHTDSDSWRVAVNASHKTDDYDILVAGSFAETGIAYSGDGNTIGIGTSGSDRDSKGNNLFIKAGANFGDGDEQRVEVSHSRFILECQCRYSIFIEFPEFNGHLDNNVPIKSQKKQPLGSKASFNDFVQTTITYTHDNLFGGALQIQLYDADQAMRFEAELSGSKQDPLIAPLGTLIEQSEVAAQKKGFRSSWSTDALFGSEGLGLQIGVDLVEDIAQQRFALTDRIWVPPMEYTSFAPFAQVSFDMDDFTISGGLRLEDGNLRVDDFTQVWALNRKFVNGGDVGYNEVLPNVGAIWRVNDQWSVFASYSKGFTLPNVGFALRKINCNADLLEGCPNDTPTFVEDILDLEAIIVDNIEIGFSWTGEDGRFGVSIFESTSELGDGVAIGADGEFELDRSPQKIQGIEMSGSYNLSEDVSISAIYSSITGKKPFVDGGPLDRELDVFNLNPNKLNASLDWQFMPEGNIVFGASRFFNRDINEGKSGEEHIKGATLFDLAINYQIGEGTLSLGIDNLLDKVYLPPTAQVSFYKNFILGRGREVSIGYTVKY